MKLLCDNFITIKNYIIRFINHLWFRVYHSASHLKTQLTLEEYKRLFEHIWTDRALHAGWNVNFEYNENDTILAFSNILC